MAQPEPGTVMSRGLRLALVTACISGVAVALNASGVRAFGDATAYTAGKNVVAAMLLSVAALVARRGHVRPPRRSVSEGLGLAFVGIVGGGVAFAMFFEGLARASSTDAAFLHKTLVVWVALLAVPILRERLTRWHVVAVVLLVCGQVVLGDHLPRLGAGSGELLIFGATLLWAVEAVVAKRLLVAIEPLALGVIRLGVGSVALLGWVFATGRADAFAGMSLSQWGWLLMTGVLLAAYVATWLSALRLSPAVDVTAVLVVGAALTALLTTGASSPAIAGATLIGMGTAAVVAGQRRDQPQPA